jgi:peptidoglycan/LPS O-acetylase OafA/YrhL
MRATGAKKRQGYIPHIEGLRALAVGIVIAYHAGVPFTRGGFIGVDVFFVISGFLITGLLLKELDETGYVDFTRFYARRARRLLPAATLVLVATAVAAWIILPPLRWRTVANDILAAALWSGNIRSALSQFDYLTANDALSPVLHFWSLGVEEQFYLLWPAVLAVGYAVLWRWMTARTAVLFASAVTLATSFAVGQLWTDSQQPFAFFLLPSRAWELAAGAFLAALYPFMGRIPNVVRQVLGVLGVVTIVAASVLLDSSVRWPGYAASIPVVATLAVIAAVGVGPRILSLRPMLAVGRWSYSLYLWHWPVLVLVPSVIGRSLRPFETLLAVVAASAAALVAYTCVENPLRTQRALLTGTWRSLALGGALVAVSSTAAVALYAAPLPQAKMTVASTKDNVERESPVGYEQLLTAVDSVSSVPFGLTPALVDAEMDRFSVDLRECFASNPVDKVPETGCYFGDVTARRTVAIVGDSHAAQWTAALVEIALREKFRLLILTKSACPPVQLRRSSEKLGSFPECQRWNNSVIQRLEDERPEVTLVAGYVGYAIERKLDSYEHRLDAWVETFDQLRVFTRPVLIADSPYPNLDVPVCLSANMENVAACVQSREAMTNGITGREAELAAAQSRDVPVIETFDLICPTQRCPVIVGNVLVYRDESHISAQFSRWLSRPLAEKLNLVFTG